MDQSRLPGFGNLPDPEPEPPDPEELHYTLMALISHHGFPAVLTELRRQSPVRSVPSAPARPSDPATSHYAAKRERDVSRFSSKSRQAKLLDLFSRMPMTDQQATVRLVGLHAPPSAFEGCRRRCSDLRAAGYLFDTGQVRHNPGSDDDSIVWNITDAGRAALESLDRTGWSR